VNGYQAGADQVRCGNRGDLQMASGVRYTLSIIVHLPKKCRRLGAKSYIVKPVDFQRLIQATP
jgi:hypothetical protein